MVGKEWLSGPWEFVGGKWDFFCLERRIVWCDQEIHGIGMERDTNFCN